MREDILNDVALRNLRPKKAYKLLYKQKKRVGRAHFIKMKITLRNHPAVTLFLKALFFLPTPIWAASIFINKALKKSPATQSGEAATFTALLKNKPVNVTVKNAELEFVLKTI